MAEISEDDVEIDVTFSTPPRESFTMALVSPERLWALEEIRQRVADGWRVSQSPFPRWWNLEASEEMRPEVAAVLWPSTED